MQCGLASGPADCLELGNGVFEICDWIHVLSISYQKKQSLTACCQDCSTAMIALASLVLSWRMRLLLSLSDLEGTKIAFETKSV